MPTGTNDNPFAPQGPLPPGQLRRYLRGELPPAEAHEVELHLENDPLVRDAAEGLALPDAMEGLARLDAHRPRGRMGVGAWAIGGLVVLATGAVLWMMTGDDPDRPGENTAAARQVGHDSVLVPATLEQQVVFTTELEQATALPESLRSAYRGGDRFVRPGEDALLRDTAIVPEDPPAPVQVLPPAPLDPAPEVEEGPKGPRRPSASRKLMFVHDLKLVHPDELYPVDPVLQLADGSVEARYGDARAQTDARPEDRGEPYERFFRTAMGKFARGDRQGCLTDLFTVLEQYPDDVNALFYAGLCCYDLGLFPRAARLLDRARTHQVDTFAEEAEWYRALSVERASGREAALPLLNAVVERGGFYAERARKHVAAEAKTP